MEGRGRQGSVGPLEVRISPILIYMKNEKIYSRPRINLENIFIDYKKHDKKKIKHKNKNKYIVIIIIAIITAIFIIKSVNPIIDSLCIDEAKNIATRISNEEATAIMKKYNYEDFITVVKDDSQNIVMLQANVNTINSISSEIPVRILERFEDKSNSSIEIYLGSIFGTKIFSGSGPKISANIAHTGNVETTLKSEFTSQGINQTLHRVYLELSIDVKILTPYDNIDTNIVNQVLIAESVLIGNIPSAYYNLNSSNEAEAMRIID